MKLVATKCFAKILKNKKLFVGHTLQLTGPLGPHPPIEKADSKLTTSSKLVSTNSRQCVWVMWVIVGHGFMTTHNNPQHGAKAWGHKSVGHVGSRGRRFKFV